MLEILASRHSEWVSLAISLGCPHYLAEDVVQEVYLRLHKYSDSVYHKLIYPDNEVNTFYMFVTIRNTLRTILKGESVFVPVDEFIFEESDNEPDIEKEEAFSRIMTKIQNEANSWGAYHSKLFNLYFMTDHSMRNISDGTDIGLTHIYNNLKSYRQAIVKAIGEDYEDYLNGDYEQI
jgi:DNA-directed RNA polymerase specialized sigma24 family protein